MRITQPHAALALVLAIALGPIPVAADLLTNSSFETGPAIPPAGTQAVAPGSAALTGWTVTGSAVTIVSDSYWAPQSGLRSVALSATAPGAISQSITSASGAPYRLTFMLSGEPFTTPVVKHLRVQAGSVTQDFTFDSGPAWHWDMKWEEKTVDFAGTGPTTTITFTSMDAGPNGPALDQLLVEAVTVGVTPGSLELALSPMAPDPLRGPGRIGFSLSRAQDVRLSVVDVQGREIAVLARGAMAAGPHELAFAPSGAGARSGLYFLVLRADEGVRVRRFTVLQ